MDPLLRAWLEDGVDFGDTGSGERYRGKRRKREPRWKLLTFILVGSLLVLNDVAPPEGKLKTLLVAADPDINRELDISKPSRQERPQPPVLQPQWITPLDHYEVTSCYDYRWGSMHYGIDLAAPYGTSIRSVGAGRVTQAGWFGDYGYTVTVDHGDGWQTVYAHTSRILVKTGQTVGTGSVIALVGSTGYSTGPHLHVGVLRYDDWFNPIPWLADRGVIIRGC